MDITTIIYNLEEDGDGTRDYLSAGETLLGALYVHLFYYIFYFNAFLKLGDKIHRVLYNATVCLFKTIPIAKLIEALVAKFQTSRTTSQWFIQFTSLHFISCSLYVQPFFYVFYSSAFLYVRVIEGIAFLFRIITKYWKLILMLHWMPFDQIIFILLW